MRKILLPMVKKKKRKEISTGSCTLVLDNQEDRELSLGDGPKHPPSQPGMGQ